MNPKVLILTGVGINSNRELAETFELAGATAEQVHISVLEDTPEKALDYQLIAFPGGFSYGDHIASGKILGNLLKFKLGDTLKELASRSVPMIGICNGFQILVKLGLLPQMGGEVIQEASLIQNNSGQYEDRWVNLKVSDEARAKSPWFKDLESLRCPVRHGEGKLVLGSKDDLARLQASGQIALRYTKEGEPTDEYPYNPNGSWDAIAGITDPSGLIFGLMPHPEVAIHGTQLPDWTRLEQVPTHTDCLKLFSNIVNYLK
ncbi:MAG: phosphoribosylformylglycinamidine synthase subunit PurQ [Planctomycetes bacterium]|nr:phosphoribosylformylglycinamidine synthase subunit PurQ [Planctomycetota bacterium]